MRRLSVLLLGALVASRFGLAPAGAAEFVVRLGESIEAALLAAPPGSTITVRDGVYREAITLTDDGMKAGFRRHPRAADHPAPARAVHRSERPDVADRLLRDG